MIDQEKIHNQFLSDDPEERIRALKQLEKYYYFLSNTQQEWSDLVKLTSDENLFVRISAIRILPLLNSEMPDKQQAWNDLVKLTTHEDVIVKIQAVQALGRAFYFVPDKQKAFDDLHRLTNDEDSSIRLVVSEVLVSVLGYEPYKYQACNDLLRLTHDKRWEVREKAAYSLHTATFFIPDKQQKWNYLLNLTSEDYDVSYIAADSLISLYYHVPDKRQAWNDLHRQISDSYSVKGDLSAYILGSLYSNVPDKQQAWNDLHRLTYDEDMWVRVSANYSLGRVSIFKASQSETEEAFKLELEIAIVFFEKAARESEVWDNPSKFCLPFYRSFHTIIFKIQEAKEVDRYLAEAKYAASGSKSKELLLEAIKNLANALKEVQELENLDFEAKKGELNFYRKYCDRAAELMRETEEKAPYATAAMRKGLPILDRNIKGLLEEIQSKAKIACQVSQGTPTQVIACEINREVQKWEIGSQEEMTQMIENLADILEKKISVQLKNQYILGKIGQMKSERNLVRQYEILAQIIPLIRNVTVVPVEPVFEKIESSQKEILDEIRKVGERLDDVVISLEPGVSEELTLHLGYTISAGGVEGGAEYTLTIPLQELSTTEIKEDLKEIAGKRISQLSMLPKTARKIVEDYLVKNKMEDLLNRLR